MIFMRTVIVFFILLCTCAEVPKARADEPGYVCSAQFENDLFGGGTDRHFTHGTAFNCLTKPIPWIVNAANKLPWFTYKKAKVEEKDLQARASLSLGQNIFTPEDISEKELIEEDRPYGGWLYLGFGLVANQGNKRFDKIELTLGMVGPWSMAEEVQETWHSLFDLEEPRGWDNQLDNEPAVNLFYEQAWRFDERGFLTGLEYDVIPHFGGALGNVFTFASAGFTVRVGPDLHEDFGPPRIRPSLPGGGFFRSRKGFNWYLFAGVEGRAVLRNIFLDGNTFSDSHSVDKKPLVGDLQAGIAIQCQRYRISYTQIFRTKEYNGQNRANQFGSLSLSYQF
jgi:lipid A 3-O-deacylase